MKDKILTVAFLLLIASVCFLWGFVTNMAIQEECAEDTFPSWEEVQPGLTMYDKGYKRGKENCPEIEMCLPSTEINILENKIDKLIDCNY